MELMHSDQEMKSRISEFASWIENPDIRTLDEVVEFNKANAEREMPKGKSVNILRSCN